MRALTAGLALTTLVVAPLQIPFRAKAAEGAQMAENATPTFATKGEAEAFLARALPEITAANPKYRSPDSDVDTRWLTKSVAFTHSATGGVFVTTDEEFEEYRKGELKSRGTHRARFALDEVSISLEASSSDTTESGEKAMGVMFKCVGAPCIEAVWNGKASVSSWTDMYLHDATIRARVLAAFQALQTKSLAR